MSRIIERFENKFEKSEGCWEWKASLHKNGYGQFRVKINDKWQQYAHRISAHLYLGFNFDPTLCVCHKCDNPKCVNPDHLFIGTTADNLKDMYDKGRYVCGTRKLSGLDRELAIFLKELGVRNYKIAKLLGVSQSTSWIVSRGMRHNHEG